MPQNTTAPDRVGFLVDYLAPLLTAARALPATDALTAAIAHGDARIAAHQRTLDILSQGQCRPEDVPRRVAIETDQLQALVVAVASDTDQTVQDAVAHAETVLAEREATLAKAAAPVGAKPIPPA